MKAAGRPMLRLLQGRLYSAQAAARPSGTTRALDTHTPVISKLPNGVVCVSLDSNGPVSKVGIVYSCGPRFESGDDVGISHFLRNVADQSTENASSFGIVRSVQQLGGSLTCQTTREHIIYQMECTRNLVDPLAEFLGHVATRPAFKPWEVQACSSKSTYDLASLQHHPDVQIVEAIHKAAYRNTLGNSLFMAPHKVGTLSPEQLHQYVADNFSGQNTTVVGFGISHNELVALAKSKLGVGQLPADSSSSAPDKVTFYGDQVRVDTNNGLVHAAVVSEGVSVTAKEVLAAGVLQRILGVGPYVKYSDGVAGSKLSKAVAAGGTHPHAVSCINFNYAESGLFGVHVVGHSEDMGKLLTTAVAEVGRATKDSVSDADLKKGKAQLQAALHMDIETSGGMFDALAKKAALTGDVFKPQEVSNAVEAVSLADVKNIAMKLASGKMSMAAVGNLSHTPFLEHLV